jgi:hypothetical protein
VARLLLRLSLLGKIIDFLYVHIRLGLESFDFCSLFMERIAFGVCLWSFFGHSLNLSFGFFIYIFDGWLDFVIHQLV